MNIEYARDYQSKWRVPPNSDFLRTDLWGIETLISFLEVLFSSNSLVSKYTSLAEVGDGLDNRQKEKD